MIIPTYQEEGNLGACLARLVGTPSLGEILVCDGGSRDRTREIAESFPGVRFEAVPRGRARQMNHGASLARGEVLWFLHADCLPPEGASEAIEEQLRDPRVQLGAFRFAVASRDPIFRLLELGVRIRSSAFQTPYGDQGLFLRTRDFHQLGGFPEIPVMEDLYLVREARRRGRVAILDRDLSTSPRRWQERGFLRTSLRNWGLVVGDWIGLRPGLEYAQAHQDGIEGQQAG